VNVQRKLETKQKVIAEYWADGPNSELPPGHWELFASFVSDRDSHSLHDDAKMFFALANAIHDAAIATWEAKRYYDYVRPVTAIRHLFRGKRIKGWNGTAMQTIDGQAWRPYQVPTFPTPPFPEYVSGHSAFSMSAAEVLKRFTNSDEFGHSYEQEGALRVEPDLGSADGVFFIGTPLQKRRMKQVNRASTAVSTSMKAMWLGLHWEEKWACKPLTKRKIIGQVAS
jgi:hypothetical protein